MKLSRIRRTASTSLAVCLALGAGALAVGSQANAQAGSRHPSSTTSGGTIYWAEPVSDPPNFIFPFMGLSYFSNANQQDEERPRCRAALDFGDDKSGGLVSHQLTP
jgi:hypothetical protein